jgi:hypothetical protein
MASTNQSYPRTLEEFYQSLSLLDLIAIRVIRNYGKLAILAIVSWLLLFLEAPLPQALGWVGYTVAIGQILFTQAYLRHFFLTLVLSASLLLNFYYLAVFVF